MKIWKLGQNALAAASKQQRLGFRQVDAEPVQLTERDVFYDVNLNHITTIIQIWYLRLYVCKSTLSR
ncbi:hypothetical protein HanLR1_Chr15g0584471 [Helianthus annuus]|nr:hypothetical protein HanLR1_Chr15g0584471 [Helianthus annuus]